jgi:hypothetical protein
MKHEEKCNDDKRRHEDPCRRFRTLIVEEKLTHLQLQIDPSSFPRKDHKHKLSKDLREDRTLRLTSIGRFFEFFASYFSHVSLESPIRGTPMGEVILPVYWGSSGTWLGLTR